MSESNCLVPVVLLCAVCIAASFSSLLYAIVVRGDIDALNERLADLESRRGCDTRAPQPSVSIDEITYDGTHIVKRDVDNQNVTRVKRKRSPQNREFINEDDVEDISRDSRRRRGQRRGGGGREEAVMRGAARPTGVPQIAIHFDGDTSKYNLGHRHYEGNGRLRHPDGLFQDWRLRDWSGHFERHFRLSDGTLTVRESGIYFVYAQVYYLDDHDVNGFRVLVNDSPVLQCTVMSHGGPVPKSNTCFTGGLVDLQSGDSIVLRDLAAMRYSIFDQGKSFFGLFRVTHSNTVAREGP